MNEYMYVFMHTLNITIKCYFLMFSLYIRYLLAFTLKAFRIIKIISSHIRKLEFSCRYKLFYQKDNKHDINVCT